jgi:hypothetical protein
MRLLINYSVQDFANAQNLHWWQSFLGLRFFRGMTVFGLALGGFYAYLTLSLGVGYVTLSSVSGFVGVFAVLMGLSLINRYIFLPRSTRKAMAQLKEYQGPWEFAFEDHKLSIKTPRGGATLPFTDFLKWSENGSSILLYRTDKMFNFLPKQQVDSAFIEELRSELLAANVPRANFWNC